MSDLRYKIKHFAIFLLSAVRNPFLMLNTHYNGNNGNSFFNQPKSFGLQHKRLRGDGSRESINPTDLLVIVYQFYFSVFPNNGRLFRTNTLKC